MIQNIDFLPAGYHHRRQRRQNRYWYWGVLAVFFVLCALGAVGQRQALRTLTVQRDRTREQGQAAVDRLESPDEIRGRIAQLDARANVVTHLRISPRPTRLLSAVTGSLPEFVTLTELKTSREPAGGRAASSTGTKKAAAPTAKAVEARLPEAIDLERLRERERSTAQFVTVTGIAPDDLAISQYLAALQDTGCFHDVQLVYTDQHALGEHRLRKFEVRLRVRKPRMKT